MNRNEITEQNRRAWNEIADIRGRRWREKFPAADLREAKSIPEEIRSAAGDVNGRELLHLQCATGEETLAWAALGARATGVDIADREIDLARARAKEAGLDADFIAADVYDLPETLQRESFDIVYTCGGILTWLPDLTSWAQAIKRALVPGGNFLLYDEHPFAHTLTARDGHIVKAADYFQRGRVTKDPPGWAHFDDHGGATEPKYEFVWTLGDVVSSIARAGLHIERLEEFPTSEEHQEWRYRGAMDEAAGLPGMFLLVATKTN
jgi:2-polyprenyl-3-methyl-5-hydroxy-6-metoxy-1,4-benzoquinol methylase